MDAAVRPSLTAPVVPAWAIRATFGVLLGTVVWLGTSLPWGSVAILFGVMGIAVRTPAAPLTVCVGLYGLTLGYNEGLQPEEVLFLLYYPVYIATWYLARVFVYRSRLGHRFHDIALLIFLGYLPVSLVLGVLHGGSLVTGANEVFNFSLFALYFPARELSGRYAWGGAAILGLLVVLGLAAIVQNVVLVGEAFSNADAAWQVARGRVPMNEMIITVGALTSVVVTALAPQRRLAFAALALFGVFTAGLAITQSRAYYVDLFLGLALLPIVLGRDGRRRFLVALVGGGAMIAALAVMFLGDMVSLVSMGIADRLLSISTATSSDISYLNRLLENRAVWKLLLENPVVGYGTGVSFSFFDSIFDVTWTKTFVHNGYLMLWFKFGLFGLLLILTTWLGLAARALWWTRTVGQADRLHIWMTIPLTAAGVTLVSLLPSHAVSATFATSETVLCVALLLGTAAGLLQREHTMRTRT